jgi:hypothetical protein
MPVKMTEEGCGKNISSPCRVHLGGWICRKLLGSSLSEEGRPVAPISGYKEGYL